MITAITRVHAQFGLRLKWQFSPIGALKSHSAMTQLTSTTDKEFLRTVNEWLFSRPEVLMLVRYSRAAGDKSFEFFTSFERLRGRLEELTPETSVTVFRERQLPLRGCVDDEFIGKCLNSVQAGLEFLVVETAPRTAGNESWFHHEAGESHEELREVLDGLRGQPVAVGEYPPWLERSLNVISAYVPEEDGSVSARWIYRKPLKYRPDLCWSRFNLRPLLPNLSGSS